jgi:hypothetical protein
MRERDTRIAASKTLHQWRHSFEQGHRQTEAIGQFRHHQRARSTGHARASGSCNETFGGAGGVRF